MRRIQVNPVHWSFGTDAELAEWKRLEVQFASYDPHYPLSGNINPTDRLEIILCHQSYLVRATDLSTYLERCPPEALKDNFQLIVDAIFSNRNKDQVWDLRSMRRMEHPREASACFRLLAPDGPLITLALRLMDDHNFLLEFPVDGLPYHLRNRFIRMDIPSFFSNKVGVAYDINLQRNVVQHLLLNPFEYYFFCYGAINLLGFISGRSDYLNGWASLQDTVYTNILEDYFAYYFPCDGSGVPCHNFNYSAQQANEAVFIANSLLRQQYPKHKMMGLNIAGENAGHPDNGAPRLFKSSILQDQAGAGGSRDNLFHTTHPSAYKEVWRSETILHIFMELWMCVFEDNVDETNPLNCVSPLSFGGLPSVEVVKSIRMLVRHSHYFINCVNSHAMHPMDDIRRNSYPIFQKRLYKFLRYLFQHWPLDNSFRIVYETWLSYIQPWRYITFERTKSQSKDVAEAPVDRRWYNFIMENILFYSKLFSQVLMRFERVDLTAPKNALMFYRVAKVMTNQDSLKLMIVEIESLIQNYERQSALPVSQTHPQRSVSFSTPAPGRSNSGGYFKPGQLSPISSPVGSPIGSPTFAQDIGSSVIKMANLKLLMKEFEHSQFVYEPLFSDSNRKRMNHLLVLVTNSRDSLYGSAAKLSTGQSKSRTFFQWLIGAPAPSQAIAQAAAEKTKAANQLEYSRNQFAQFFEISNGESIDQMNHSQEPTRSFYGQSNWMNSDSSPLFNAASGSSSSIFNEDYRRKAFLPADVLPDEMLIPLGNPDLSLLRSDECRPVVRLMFALSSFVNNRFQKNMETYYFSKSCTGRIVRAILAEPKEYYLYEKRRGPGKPLKYTKYLPPRLTFRFLGSYICWCYIFTLYVLGCFLGLSFFGGSSLFLSLFVIYLIIRALSEPVNKWGELNQRYLLSQAVDEVDIGLATNKSKSKSKHPTDNLEPEVRQRSFLAPDSPGMT